MNISGVSFRLLCSTLLIAVVCVPSTKHGIVYYSPLNGARWVRPQTTIIIRSAAPVAPAHLSPDAFIRVIGSQSGSHTLHMYLTADGRTMTFTPDSAFLPSETVSVDWQPGMPTVLRDTLAPFRFSFSISADVSARDLSPAQAAYLTSHRLILPERTAAHPQARPLFKTHTATVDTALYGLLPSIKQVYDNHPSPGGVFWTNTALIDDSLPSYIIVSNNDGTPAYYQEMPSPCIDFTAQANGHFTYYDWGSTAFYEMDPLDPYFLKIYYCRDGYQTDQHDIRFLPNGHYLLMGQDVEYVDMSTVVPGGLRNAQIIGLVVEEYDEADELVFQWRGWDHFQITDATHEDLTQPTIDYVHGNAVELDTDGNILLSSRHLDEITKIDRTTGDIIWRWGGKNNQFVFVNDTLGFSHQHDIRRIKNGHVTLFDNGNYHEPAFSRACEYALDEQAKTATLVWQYVQPQPTFSPSMGNVQRLDDGNTVIGWGASSSPAMTEVTPDGTKTFEMSLPENVISYRVFRFDLHSVPTGTPIVGGFPRTYALEQNFPNPFNPTTTIAYDLPFPDRVVVTVFDVLGRRVATLVNEQQRAGRYQVEFNGADVASGMYICRIETPSYSQNIKMILMK